jgi:hypothetical protein
VIAWLVAPRQRRNERIYSPRPALWTFRLIAVPALIKGIGVTVQAAGPTPGGPRGVLLFLAALLLVLAFSVFYWCATVGVHVTDHGVRSVSFSTKPIFIPWTKIARFDYAPQGNDESVYLIATDGTLTRMRMLGFRRWLHKLGTAYCEALNDELARHQTN